MLAKDKVRSAFVKAVTNLAAVLDHLHQHDEAIVTQVLADYWVTSQNARALGVIVDNLDDMVREHETALLRAKIIKQRIEYLLDRELKSEAQRRFMRVVTRD